MFGKKGSKILKLPPVRNCFTSAMANKLVVVINSVKVPKIKKILLCEIKFIVPNYSCLQNPWLGGYHPQVPVLSVLNWICWTSSPPHPKKKFLGTPLTVALRLRTETVCSGMWVLTPSSRYTLPVPIFSTSFIEILSLPDKCLTGNSLYLFRFREILQLFA